MEVRRSYKYRLYRCDRRDKLLRRQIVVAGTVWNHALALQKRYYRLTGAYVPIERMKAHIARLRMRTQRYAFWKAVGSQAVQDVLERLDGSKVRIGKHIYRCVKHRPLRGTVKTLTVKRDAADRLWLIFSVVQTVPDPKEPTISQVAGFDFGLKTFLTDHTGTQYMSGLHHLHALKRLRKMQSRKDRKPHGTNNRIADRRRDEHYRLAHALCERYDLLCFEDLNLNAMKRLWGRKVSDLAFGQFMTILKQVADKRNKVVKQIGRFERTTGRCSRCGHRQDLTLRERVFQCQSCGLTLDRDHNAAINILNAGASATRPIDAVRPLLAGAALPDGRSPSL